MTLLTSSTRIYNDHCENDFKCTNTTFYVHEKELERIHNPHPLDFRYNPEDINSIFAPIKTSSPLQEELGGVMVKKYSKPPQHKSSGY